MSYGAEVVIPIETSFPTLRTQLFNPSDNDELLEKSLDLVEERKETFTKNSTFLGCLHSKDEVLHAHLNLLENTLLYQPTR